MTENTDLAVVILAAGKGTRMNKNMKTPIPKVGYSVGKKTMINRVLTTVKKLKPSVIIVVCSKDNITFINNEIKNLSHSKQIRFVIQTEISGTASAVLTASKCVKNKNVLVMLGDVPLITYKTLLKVINQNGDATILGFKCNKNNDNRFGRIFFNKILTGLTSYSDEVEKIVEYNECTEEQKKNIVCNSGMLYISKDYFYLLEEIKNNNSKQEYYLTDIIKIMKEKRLNVSYVEGDKNECVGANTTEELKELNKIYKKFYK